jgi:hypothetical protein
MRALLATELDVPIATVEQARSLSALVQWLTRRGHDAPSAARLQHREHRHAIARAELLEHLTRCFEHLTQVC